MFSHKSATVASKKIIDTQMSPAQPSASTAPLTINTALNEEQRTNLESPGGVDLSDMSQCK